jgi:aldehyde:ferredoxin oxidoreductase
MPGYHTGPGCYLGFLIGARHSHLDSAGYSLDQRAIGPGESTDATVLVDALLEEERWRQILASLVVCFFARGVYTHDLVRDALASVGIEADAARLAAIGAGILRRKNAFKAREGFDVAALRIPERICETPSPTGSLSADFLRDALTIAKDRMAE